MEIYKAYKFRLYPTRQQRDYFNRCIGCGRFVYNWALSMRINAYKEDGTTLYILKDIKPKIPLLKEEKPFLKEVDSNGLIYELIHLESAFRKFFEKQNGYPKFKKRTSSGNIMIRLPRKAIDKENKRIKIPKIGYVKCVFHRDIEGFIKETPFVRISRTSIGEWYISIFATIDVPNGPNLVANQNNTIGVDLGLKDFAILDNGTKFHKIEVNKNIVKRKKHLQRMLQKKVGAKKGQKKSNNYLKIQQKIAKIDKKVARRRENYHYKVASDIISIDCIYIATEDLNVRCLSASGKSKQKLSQEEYLKLSKTEKKKYNRKKNKGFNKSILNAGFYSFKTKLTFKAQQKGKEVIEVGRFYASSQTCSNCGAKNKLVKNLNVREWVCPECGSVHDRDINAALNIKKEGIRIKNNGETTRKNLRRCTPKVKSAETIMNEKTCMVGVNSKVVESEMQYESAFNKQKSFVKYNSHTKETNL